MDVVAVDERAEPAPPADVPPTRGVGGVLLVGGLVGAVVSLVLLLDKLALLADPTFVPACSIDPVLSCGTIMKTWQASLLGFPNPVIGLLTFPVAAAMGALVLGGVALPRWAWWSLQAGTTAGMLFVHWLVVQSLAVIHALCPWCMVAWVAVIAMFWWVTVANLRAGHLGGAPAALRHHGWGLAAWYLAIVVAIVATFPAWAAGLVGL
ncbi:vitamin K epoxide reductase family protein [Actinomycetospora lemnae]|uniref:Vitamin K epoxide reductase family protein n=1 Tax=Actinomycetospora lemnae TaxID=3019891 RepID=A0ABT5SXK5_9PSEU|nr:vitamin K epoxide reductase family protein [Actinomycetospora sp. DW7H6]MDD7966737.1 vitamin K epoxide reductase family protein [Actinomycetospora sp. DW7H6]